MFPLTYRDTTFNQSEYMFKTFLLYYLYMYNYIQKKVDVLPIWMFRAYALCQRET